MYYFIIIYINFKNETWLLAQQLDTNNKSSLLCHLV